MNYRKLISCLLIAVLLLQVVSVGGVASADPVTPLDQLNYIRSSDDDIDVAISDVQSLLESGSLIDMTDISNTYDLLNDEQKKELARGMIFCCHGKWIMRVKAKLSMSSQCYITCQKSLSL